MKPDNWDRMPKEIKEQWVHNLMRDIRGQIMVGKALYIASKAIMEKRYPESSDAGDMEMIAEVMFPIGWAVEEADVKYRKEFVGSKDG